MSDQTPRMLYTPEQKLRRDASAWTLVQGILAPVQFIIFLVSLGLVLHCLTTGEGETTALWSVVVKTIALYTIMVTGCIWEKVVFDKYLFAEAFFWEDVFSMLVLALHTLYLWTWWTHRLSASEQLWLALAAYFAYCINAAQFIWKLRAARLQSELMQLNPSLPTGVSA
jgi:3-vinyl bacteriochlorophyllide hydratase